jgi:hypothetical protein
MLHESRVINSLNTEEQILNAIVVTEANYKQGFLRERFQTTARNSPSTKLLARYLYERGDVTLTDDKYMSFRLGTGKRKSVVLSTGMARRIFAEAYKVPKEDYPLQALVGTVDTGPFILWERENPEPSGSGMKATHVKSP